MTGASIRRTSDALAALMAARVSVSPIPAALEVEHATSSIDDIVLALARAGTDSDRRQLGQILAMRFVAIAVVEQTNEANSDASFRLGQHFKTIASSSDVARGARLAGVLAAAALFKRGVVRSPRKALGECELLEKRLASATPDWLLTTGLEEASFRAHTDRISVGRTPKSESAKELDASQQVAKPGWLKLGPIAAWDPQTTAVAPFPTGDPSAGLNEDVTRAVVEAYSAFTAKGFEAAAKAALSVGAAAGRSWGPSRSADSQQLWAWLRLVAHMPIAVDQASPRSRLNALSACSLTARISPLFGELAAELIQRVVEDLRTGGPDEEREWAQYIVRLLAVHPHGEVMQHLDNSSRAQLRAICATVLGSWDLSSVSMSSDLADAITSQYRAHLNAVHVAYSAGDTKIDRGVRRALLEIAVPEEQALFRRGFELLDEVARARSTADLTGLVQGLHRLAAPMDELAAELRDCGSAFLQELLQPGTFQFFEALRDATDAAGATASPDVVCELQSHRLPLAATGIRIGVVIRIRNVGAASATRIRVKCRAASLDFSGGATSVETLDPGQERPVTLYAVGTRSADSAEIDVQLEWADGYGLKHERRFQLVAEAEAASEWLDTDVDPFTLSEIRDPNRLVGRDADLDALRQLLRGGTSVFVTGQKRVGKSSLVRVALKVLRDESTATHVVPYGFVQAFESTDELIANLLLSLRTALESQFPHQVVPDLPTAAGSAAAGLWVQSVGEHLPPGYQLVLAIDDFDELPREFFEGASADQFFTFVRALISEPWFTLVLVGSEVMPTIIRSQGYKLNQVSGRDVNAFPTAALTGQLLREPSSERLEWEEHAVERIHLLTGGNPYFSTLLAQRIWQTLKSRDRTFVSTVDVVEASAALARDAEPSHFVHLWADGPAGVDPESEASLQNAALLLAVARCAAEDGSAEREEVEAVASTGQSAELRRNIPTRLQDLLDRGVLRSNGDRAVSFVIPLAERWFRFSGQAHLSEPLREIAVAAGELEHIPDRAFIDIARRLSVESSPVSDIQVRSWLRQFKDPRARRAAFRMLERLSHEGNFSLLRIEKELVPGLRDAFLGSPTASRLKVASQGGYTTNVAIVYLSSHDRSAAMALGAALRVPQRFIHLLDDFLSEPRLTIDVVLVFEVFAGDGASGNAALGAIIDHVSVECSYLVCIAAGLQSGQIGDHPGARFVVLDAVPRLLAFDASSEVFKDPASLRDAEQQIATISRRLDPSCPLGWPGGLLLRVEGHLPTYMPAVFRSRGAFAGVDWEPLFLDGAEWTGVVPGDSAVAALLRRPEASDLEFKSSLRTNVPEGSVNKDLELSVLKTLAAFMNTEGGTLLIGVADDGAVVGLEGDYASSQAIENWDGFERHTMSLAIKAFGEGAAQLIRLRRERAEGHDLCVAQVDMAMNPVYMTSNRVPHLYVRTGAATRSLPVNEVHRYCQSRFIDR